MAYDTQELLKKAKKAIKEHDLVFIEEIAVYIGVARQTFYDHFPDKSDNYKTLLDLLNQNRIRLKGGLRKKWYETDNATSQKYLYLLIGTDRDRDKITQNYNKTEHSGAIGTLNLDKDPDALKTLLRTFDVVKDKSDE